MSGMKMQHTANQQFHTVIGTSGYVPTLGADAFGSLSDLNYHVAQGFLIHSNGTNPIFTFNKAMQVHHTDLSLKSAKIHWPGITLLAQSYGQTRSTVVAFNERMTNGLEVSYDAGLLFSSSFNV